MSSLVRIRAEMIHLTIENGPHRGITRVEITRRSNAMVRALQLKNIELSILLTGDKHIHELNKLYRDKDRPTDVLAFAMREGELGHLAGGVLGDVIVSVETARKQASERSVDVLEEVTMLVAHGLLHLLGWDHDTDAKDRRMRAETDRLCRAARGDVGSTRKASKAGAKAKAPQTNKAKKKSRSVMDSKPRSAKKPKRPHRIKARRSSIS